MLSVRKCKRIEGIINVPGDKSISHRAVMLGSLAKGKTVIRNFLMGEDCLSTVACFRALGVKIDVFEKEVVVYGSGFGLSEPDDVLDCGNSGTTARLMLGILAGQNFCSIVTGDDSLKKRPMKRVVDPLLKMGAKFLGKKDSTLLPLAVKGGELKPIYYEMPVASAQVKSCILLAGLFADGVTYVKEPALTRDHTERMLKHFGAEVDIEHDNRIISVKGRPVLNGCEVIMPGDISSAAFFMVAAAAIPESDIIIKDVGLNPTRDGIIEVLQEMGADIKIIDSNKMKAGEPVGDIRIKGGKLKGTVVGGSIIPRLIDEIPVLAVAAAVAEGKTVFKDAKELRVKETDRIAAVARELAKFGVHVEEKPDGMIVHSTKSLNGAVCESYGDHRIAMAMAIAGLLAEGETIIKNTESINISFPSFENLLKSVAVF